MGRRGTRIGGKETTRKTKTLIILRWMVERWDGVMWTGLVCLRIGTGGDLM
jgi:hypothetical protein